MIKAIAERSDKVLGMSEVILQQITSFGVPTEKLGKYKYWIDTDRFKPIDPKAAKEKTGIDGGFTVLFVGRLIEKKGATLLAGIAAELQQIQFVFYELRRDRFVLFYPDHGFSNRIVGLKRMG